MNCRDIILGLEQLAPKKLAEDWDNVGLLIGREDKDIHKIMLALDPSESVVDQCVAGNVDMLITHHPILFSSVKQITYGNPQGRKLMKLIGKDISCYAMHTNFDVAVMAREAARRLGITNTKILDKTYEEKLYKLVVYVPVDSVDVVRQAFMKEDAGHIGNYSGCSFGTQGIGNFKPLEGTNPYIGEVNKMAYVQEVRLETIVRPEKLDSTIQAMLRAHPYEEVAYDVYELENRGNVAGVGCYGYLNRDMLFEELIGLTKEVLKLDHVKVSGNLNRMVGTVAVSPGAGKSVIKNAIRAKADVLITGDIDHHAALDALEDGLMIIDAGHFGTEHLFVDFMRSYLYDYLYRADHNYVGVPNEIEIISAKEEGPFRIL